MAKIKSFTSLEQAKVLLKILPHQSADMSFNVEKGYEVILHPYMTSNWIGVPCWSLLALLGVLPTFTIDSSDDHYFRIHCQQKFSEWHDNPVDACYEIILKLHELNLL